MFTGAVGNVALIGVSKAGLVEGWMNGVDRTEDGCINGFLIVEFVFIWLFVWFGNNKDSFRKCGNGFGFFLHVLVMQRLIKNPKSIKNTEIIDSKE